MKRYRIKPLRIQLLLSIIFSTLIFTQATANTRSPEVNAEQSLEATIYFPIVGNSFVGSADEYYLSPTGNDNNSGRSEAQAWATFDHAWQYLYPGDTLILLDGIYYQSIIPYVRDGEPGNPITIKAKNDGKAIIDGQNQRATVALAWYDNWDLGHWYVIEGIVARNSSDSVFMVNGDNNILRRVSAYNANTDKNTHAFWIYGKNNLLEDCVASGTGRKMILLLSNIGGSSTVRRCFADWREWDGREWHDCWPWGDGIEIYNSSNNIIENSISYSRNPTQSINVLAQGLVEEGDVSNSNKILGSMAILSGMKEDGTPMVWGDTRPQPSEYSCVREFHWPAQRSGFNVTVSGTIVKDNLWQDIFAWGSAGLGISWGPGAPPQEIGNNRIVRATVYNNGLDNPGLWGGIDTDTTQADLERYTSVENSKIEKIFVEYDNEDRVMTSMDGEGARLIHRYIDGILMDGSNGQPAQNLWPWPMEDRIQAELGISVTDIMTDIIFGTSDLSEIYP